MNTSAADAVPRATSIHCADEELIVQLADGRRLSTPLAWFPRLLGATPAQRAAWRLIGLGEGIHWEGLDEDVSVGALLRGEKARR